MKIVWKAGTEPVWQFWIWSLLSLLVRTVPGVAQLPLPLQTPSTPPIWQTGSAAPVVQRFWGVWSLVKFRPSSTASPGVAWPQGLQNLSLPETWLSPGKRQDGGDVPLKIHAQKTQAHTQSKHTEIPNFRHKKDRSTGPQGKGERGEPTQPRGFFFLKQFFHTAISFLVFFFIQPISF